MTTYRTLLLPLLLLTFLPGLAVADDEKAPTLDELLDERIEINEKYREEFIADAEETEVAKDLVPIEKMLGDEWVEHLKYVKASKDAKLKAMVLRLELLTELQTAYYDLEFGGGFAEKAKARADLAKWKKKLDAVEAAKKEK